MSKFLIACLGNIGEEYSFTRHNIGFEIADALAQSFVKEGEKKTSPKVFVTDKLAMVNHSRFKGKPLVIIKPTTYMNLSGKAVNYWLQTENISISNMLVIADDLALPFGTLRIKKKGSDGGHNGLTDIIAALGTNEFPRLRFGIGSEFSKGKQVDYVLGKWSAEEQKSLPERIETAVQMIKSFISIGIDRTMSDFNNK
ncbi:MAG: aminoacyl-tRNA hydrolase [Bacteroidetes bacterium]|nr:aminoacyl-tRNA hydrolase [Bacteroidota bacterium]